MPTCWYSRPVPTWYSRMQNCFHTGVIATTLGDSVARPSVNARGVLHRNSLLALADHTNALYDTLVAEVFARRAQMQAV